MSRQPGRARAGYPHCVSDPIILGYDPQTLRELIDVEAAEARLAEVAPYRSLTALNEQVVLLRLLDRLDEAFEVAQLAYRQSRFTGAREDALAARIRRAQVQHRQGRLEPALVELSGAVDEAISHEWHQHAGSALHSRGRIRFELGDYAAALADFEQALQEREHEGTPHGQVEATTYAIRATRAIIEGEEHPRSEGGRIAPLDA